MSLLTVGSVAFDGIKTPYGEAEKVIGGAATYICYAASYFTKNIYLSAIIGDDWPEEEIKALQQRGVDIEGLEIKKGRKSFYWQGSYHDNMNSRDTLQTDLNVLDEFNPILPTKYGEAEFVMLGNLTPAVQAQVLDQLHENSTKLVALDTMNFWMDIALEELLQVIKRIDVLIINDEEARQLSGTYSLAKAARQILELGPKYLVIKKGEHGALLFSPDQMFFAPALPLTEVIDPTGAGDTFAGGFMGYLDKTKNISFENMKRAIIAGSALASFCVEDFSLNRLKRLSKDELEARISQFKDLVHFNY